MANPDDETRTQLDAALCDVLELVPDALVIVDQDGRIVHVNQSAERLFMYPAGALTGQPLEVLVPERYRAEHEQLRREYGRAAKSRDMGSGASLKLLRGDGQEIPVDISLQPWASPHGQLILAAVRDVTLRMQREDALRASEERFALAVRGSTDGIWDWNVLTNEVYYSSRFKELLGCEDHEMENVFASFESRLLPEDVARVHAALADHFEQHKPYDIEYRLRTKAGEYRWFRARGQAVWDGGGRPSRMAGSISDITEQKRSQQRFELAVRVSPVALLIVDGAGAIRLVNAQLESDFGYRAEELLGRSVEMLVPERFRAAHREFRETFFQNRESRVMGRGRELFALRRDGSEFPIEVGLSLLETDEELLVLCGIANLTERKQAMAAMQAAKEAAEAANRAKSDFLANMSHEIRTPLNAVIGMTELVLDTELTPQQREYLTMVTDAGDLLLSIINEILDFSKIEAGRVELETTAFHLRDLLGDTMRTLAPRAHSRGLELAYEVDPHVPDRLLGDGNRLRQVLLNLVGNAIKFTERGEVVVRFDCQPPTADGVQLRCEVADTGIGIAAEKQALIFEAFVQSDTSTTRQYGGTGLGLTICRRLVDLMGGAIWVQSELGRGSTFSFTARFGLVQPQEGETPSADVNVLVRALGKAAAREGSGTHRRAESAPHVAKSLRVLLAEDSAMNQKLVVGLLGKWGHTVHVAANGRAAIQAWEQEAFDLILMDVQMPEMNGFEATAAIRQRELQSGGHIPIIALTAHALRGDREQCLAAGMDSYVAKPLRHAELLQAIQACCPTTSDADSQPRDRTPE